MTLSGVPIRSSAPFALITPIPAMRIPLISASKMAVCTVSDISFSLPDAKKRAASTLAPSEIPINRLVNTLMSAVVDPTAASACFPVKCPTTMISTALNISCKIPDSMSGSANEISLSMIEPLHISISYLFVFKFSLPLSGSVIPLSHKIRRYWRRICLSLYIL